MSSSDYKDDPTLEKKTEAPPPFQHSPSPPPQEGYQPAPQQWQQPMFPAQQQAPPHYYPTPAGPPAVQQQSTNNVVVVQQPGYNTYAPARPSDYLGLSLFACLCCCWPIAIVALIHSCQVNDRYNAGDYAGALDSSRKARYWSKVSIIVGIVLTVVWIGLSVAPPHYYPSPAELPVPQQQHTNNTVVVQQPGYNTYVNTRPNNYLGLSLFACLCCCWPIAIVALHHSCQVDGRYNAGDYARAIDSSRRAKHWSKVAIIVGIFMTFGWIGLSLVSFGIRFAAGASGANSDPYN